MHYHPYIDLPQVGHILIHRRHPDAGDSDFRSTAGPTKGL
ncbi:hypothetical protein LCGC14_1548190 [marine sediment metagenome]|uniref:Uncharacterized protein n=1 Tax=marine sediment metagenome TaxID=412755 RepID=A0A0F9L731_9ZZZZ